jgi:hypothetical protein
MTSGSGKLCLDILFAGLVKLPQAVLSVLQTYVYRISFAGFAGH